MSRRFLKTRSENNVFFKTKRIFLKIKQILEFEIQLAVFDSKLVLCVYFGITICSANVKNGERVGIPFEQGL